MERIGSISLRLKARRQGGRRTEDNRRYIHVTVHPKLVRFLDQIVLVLGTWEPNRVRRGCCRESLLCA
jgi:hypothetical protein